MYGQLKNSPKQGTRLPNLLSTLLLIVTLPSFANAQAWLPENTRASLDFSSRVIESAGVTWTQHAIGLDVHKVFSGARGDVGVLTFQPYLVRIDDAPMVPGIFDDNHDHALQWRIANFNYTGIGHGRFNIRVGHMEVPFGLEQIVQTNGTLYQMDAPRVSSLKADWGVSINGVLPWLEYEIARTQGSGNEISSSSDGLLAGRIGLPRDGLWWVGFSALDGEIERGPNEVEQQRVALDAGMRLPRGFNLMLQRAQGEDGPADVTYHLAELNWSTPAESTFVYSQWRGLNKETNGDTTHQRDFNLGVRYEPNAHFSASLEVRHHVDADDNDISGAFQLRYRL